MTLTFATPLPDDRFTITVSDNLTDPGGNKLDGESNATSPTATPTFPTGDGVPGGAFAGRFTVDSRPEIGSFVAQNINLDINGNFVWDPANAQIGNDATNVDLTFSLGVANANGSVGLGGYNVHDLAFAGKFETGQGNGIANKFDQLAAYGFSSELGARRWMIDTDSDGVVTLGTDILTIQPNIAGFNVAGALPVAGNYDGNAANGDEIGLYNAGTWAFDINRNFVIEPFEVIGNNGLLGHPIIGDFDGDGLDDAAVFNNNVLTFDLAFNGFNGADDTIVWGFPGVLDRPVAADMDQDGIDDIGLWVPRNSAQSNRPIAEWYFLLSGNPSAGVRNAALGTANLVDHPFEPVPFGNDLYAEFGDELALPIVGNFDPPVASPVGPDINPNTVLVGDYSGDGSVGQEDYAVWRSSYGSTSNLAADGNGDGVVDTADYAVWRDNIGAVAAPAASAPAPAATEAYSSALAAEAAAIRGSIIDEAIIAPASEAASLAAMAFATPMAGLPGQSPAGAVEASGVEAPVASDLLLQHAFVRSATDDDAIEQTGQLEEPFTDEQIDQAFGEELALSASVGG